MIPDQPVDAEALAARRRTFRLALAVGGASGLACLAFGKTPENAIADGLMASFGGLIAWSTYHLISGRNDASGLVGLSTLPLWRESDDPMVATLVINSLVMLMVGVVMGIVNRPPRSEPDFDADDGSTWDRELDGSPRPY